MTRPRSLAPVHMAVLALAVLGLTGCGPDPEAEARSAQAQAQVDAETAERDAAAERGPPPVINPVGDPRGGRYRVARIGLGSATGANGEIAEERSVFGAKDPLMVAVTIAPRQSGERVTGRINVKWLYQEGQVVLTENKVFDTGLAATTVFELKIQDGALPGRYTVEITAEGQPPETRSFDVQETPAS